MRTPVMAVLAVVMLLALVAGPARAMDAKAIFARSEKSVVVVLVYDSRGKVLGQGSGFYVGQGDLVVTNHHVVKNAASVKIKANGDELLDVEEIKAVDEAHDLALLRVPTRGAPLDLYAGAGAVGSEVVAIGTPLGFEKTISTGIISGQRMMALPNSQKEFSVYQMTAPTSPGSSGGPVLDAQGRVLAVATAGVLQGAQNINFAVPSAYVLKLMGKRGSSGIQLAPEQSVGIEKDKSGAIHIFAK